MNLFDDMDNDMIFYKLKKTQMQKLLKLYESTL